MQLTAGGGNITLRRTTLISPQESLPRALIS